MWKIILPLLLAIGLFSGGFYLGRGDKQIEERIIVKKGETEVKIIERTVEKIRIVKPDGTVIEKEIVKDKDSKTKEKDKISESESIISPVMSNYSVAASVWVPLDKRLIDRRTYSIDSIEVSVGRRLLGDAWVDAGYRLNNELSLGLRLQF